MPTITQKLSGNRKAKIHFPRAEIAILRHDAETSHTPSYDLGGLPALADDRWQVSWFDAGSFGGMLGQPSPFSALVFGYNAIAFADEVRTALHRNPPTVPLVFLHQLHPDCFESLRGRLRLKLEQDDRVDIDHASVPIERSADDEILLRFPPRERPRGRPRKGHPVVLV
jgi:hypothetical protein